MDHNLSERAKFAKTLIEEMFKVESDQTVAITLDSGGDRETADAIFNAVSAVGGKPLLMTTPKAIHEGQAGVKYWPAKALEAALCNVDIWIELNSSCITYSAIWEAALAKNVRYLVLADSSIESLIRVFNSFEVLHLKSLLQKVKSMVESTKTIRITSENGTDISYDTNQNYPVDLDDGDFSTKIFGTAPGYVNVVPKQGSMNGRIVFDDLMFSKMREKGEKVEFVVKDGKIVEINGGEEAEHYKIFLAQFNDENVYKISHNMFGLNPGVQELCGEIVEDERIWGGVDFGFGHTSPMDMPPNGQQAETHFDGVVIKVNLYFDGIEIFKEGEVVHPEIKSMADRLISK